jgi:hypothetical protein
MQISLAVDGIVSEVAQTGSERQWLSNIYAYVAKAPKGRLAKNLVDDGFVGCMSTVGTS